MIIQCTSCGTRYHYDEDRFAGRPSRKIRCARCREVFEIRNPAEGEAVPAAVAAAIPALASTGEDTRQNRSRSALLDKEVTAPAVPFAQSEERSIEAEAEPASPEPQMNVAEIPVGLPKGKRLSLAIIDGPGSGKVYRIEKARITIGRSGADLVLDDTEASRAHAALEIHDTRILLEDLGSTNGTLIDEIQIEGRVELQNHGEFVVGTTTIMLIMTDDA